MSFIHYLTVGFFDIRRDQLGPGSEPVPQLPLDRKWVETRLSEIGSKATDAFWFTESGCLWTTYSWEGVAREIATHHGMACVVVHQNQGLIVWPPQAVVEQFRVNGWSTPLPGTAWVDVELFASDGSGKE
ncbi:MAG: hypothetical protein EXS16_15385 [Gemmataceae bacterium]|nr:hypothetical protein [Gemmataceae bacterium]